MCPGLVGEMGVRQPGKLTNRFNSKMYQLFFPAKPLQPFVDCYWMLHINDSERFEVGESIFVDSKADIIFNFGCPYQRDVPTQSDRTQLVVNSNFDAPREYPVLIAQQGEIHLVGIRFKPGGISAFLPIPVDELKNQVIDLRDIFDDSVLELEARLFDEMANPEAQVVLLNQFLLKRLLLRADTQFAFQVAQHIVSSAGKSSVQDLSRESGYSSRHLNRIYQQCLGVSPKFHARVVRFHHALAHLIANPQLKPLDLVEKCGYYDQSHLAKDFVEFSGQNLNQYRAFLSTKAATPPPNLVRFLQDK